MTRLREFWYELRCRWFGGHRGPLLLLSDGSDGDVCTRCKESLWEGI